MLSEFQSVNEVAREILGFEGKLLSGSKTAYLDKHPQNAAVFNANVFSLSGKLWYGDLDLSLSQDVAKLKALAQKLGTVIYVVPEHLGRFNKTNLTEGEILQASVWSSDRDETITREQLNERRGR